MSDENDGVRLTLPVHDRDHVLGTESAAVTLVEYGNYECIYCRQLHPNIKEVLRRAEGLRFVFRHFPLRQVHPHSTRAAEAAEAAAAQGRFWEMHDLLFRQEGKLDDEQLARCAGKAGLDLRRYREEMAAGAYAEKIDRELMETTFVGKVSGTPTIYLNGVRRSDLRGLEGLLAAVEAAGATLRAGPGAWAKTLNRLRKLRLV
ncbi:MAG: thioredoxin domain-containing protein [Acidobacteria bacterium]|nr:thioredoxin domain-containing protein [Acidobacteriota bacterium]